MKINSKYEVNSDSLNLTLLKNSLNCLKLKKNFSPKGLNSKKQFYSNNNSGFILYVNEVWKFTEKYKSIFDSGYKHEFSKKLKFNFLKKNYENSSSFDIYLKRGSLVSGSQIRDSIESSIGLELVETARLLFYGFKDYRNFLLKDLVNIQETSRFLYRERLIFKLFKSKNFNIVNYQKKNIIRKTLNQDFLITKLNYIFKNYNTSKNIKEKLKYKRLLRDNVKIAHSKLNFPIFGFLKKTIGMFSFSMNKPTRNYDSYELYRQYLRHPSTQLRTLTKYIKNSLSIENYRSGKIKIEYVDMTAQFFRIYWRYFKFKIERFFYNHLHVRVHIWFLNIWDVFLSGVDALWRWFRYENKTTYFLTKKGQRFLIEDRENAKFYVRTMTLTLTMVGGVKLFMDNVSLLMKKYRNNWAFILHTTKSLRFCINYFWFRFFVNYKVTLQGKIGGFLRAQKKTFKKGNVSIENKSSAITYYRGFPVTRFGSYNLSFWLQYRIPNLVEKYGDLEYVDTMKVLLNMYSVPWLVSRLSVIIQHMLMERVYRTNRKLAQYARRIESRQIMVYQALGFKKYHFKNMSLKVGNITRFNKLKDIVLKKKYKKIFNRSIRKNITKKWFSRKINKQQIKKNNLIKKL